MSRWLNILILSLLGYAGLPNWPGLQAAPADAPLDTARPPTEITAKTMQYDMKSLKLRLEGDVVVTDTDMKLKADLVIVTFDENNQAKTIEATGNVVIVHGIRTATAGKANYDVASDRVVLTESPVLQEGGYRQQGAERVILDRREGSFRADGGTPVITFTKGPNQEGSLVDKLKQDMEKPSPNGTEKK